MDILRNVFNHYTKTKQLTGGLARKVGGAKDQQSLLVDIPILFRTYLQAVDREDAFHVMGSIGNGQMSRVPWVGVFRKAITTSAQNGYYIVLLFSEDFQSCYLSLNQGFTAFKEQYSSRLALLKIEETAKKAIALLTLSDGEISGPIDLSATRDLGLGYQQGSIVSYRYSISNLPTETQLRHDFSRLLQHYNQLFQLVGTSLHELSPVTETQYQQTVLEKLNSTNSVVEPAGGILLTTTRTSSTSKHLRDPKYAAKALQMANFKCELDPNHQTFISSAKNRAYIEAHHLIPLSYQENFFYSLDVSANIVALCPNCHRFLHHARAKEKRRALKQLFVMRHKRLEEKQLVITEEALLGCYSNDLLEEEA